MAFLVSQWANKFRRRVESGERRNRMPFILKHETLINYFLCPIAAFGGER